MENSFTTLDELLDEYSRDELVPIDTIKQAIYYVTHGLQPILVWPKEDGSGRATFWFRKSDTRFVYALWQATKPGEEKIEVPYVPKVKKKPKFVKIRDVDE